MCSACSAHTCLIVMILSAKRFLRHKDADTLKLATDSAAMPLPSYLFTSRLTGTVYSTSSLCNALASFEPRNLAVESIDGFREWESIAVGNPFIT
jgi:hypothetical protein